MKWEQGVPGTPGWYAIQYAVDGASLPDGTPGVEYLTSEDLEDYQKDRALGLDPDLQIWFYGPFPITVPEFDGSDQ